MELEGSFENGVIIPDDATQIPPGSRVKIVVGDANPPSRGPYAGLFDDLMVDDPNSPGDRAAQYEHYRLNRAKRWQPFWTLTLWSH